MYPIYFQRIFCDDDNKIFTISRPASISFPEQLNSQDTKILPIYALQKSTCTAPQNDYKYREFRSITNILTRVCQYRFDQVLRDVYHATASSFTTASVSSWSLCSSTSYSCCHPSSVSYSCFQLITQLSAMFSNIVTCRKIVNCSSSTVDDIIDVSLLQFQFFVEDIECSIGLSYNSE